jgi:hypothetical protein
VRDLWADLCGDPRDAVLSAPHGRRLGDPGAYLALPRLPTTGALRYLRVAAFGLDERTVGHWQARAGRVLSLSKGRHCQQVHEAIVQQGRVELGHVQADELWVKLVGKRVWMAMALAVPPFDTSGACGGVGSSVRTATAV